MKCRICECTELDACIGSCEWIEKDLCFDLRDREPLIKLAGGSL